MNHPLINYLNNQKNLPDWMRDFHDQKDLFKAIYQQWQGKENNDILDKVNWTDSHVFTIDIFLWWMGLHGYKLQKDRTKNIDFYDAEDTIRYYLKERRKKLPPLHSLISNNTSKNEHNI